MPLVWLVVASLLLTPPPPVRLHLCLSSRHSCASCPAGCYVTFCHATTASHCLRFHLSLCHCLSSAPLPPLFRLVVASPLVTPPSPVRLPSASHRTTASHRAPLAPYVWLVVALPLVTPLPPVSLRLCLSGHCRVLAVLLLGGGE